MAAPALGVALEAALCHGAGQVSCAHVALQIRLAVRHLLRNEHLQMPPRPVTGTSMKPDSYIHVPLPGSNLHHTCA